MAVEWGRYDTFDHPVRVTDGRVYVVKANMITGHSCSCPRMNKGDQPALALKPKEACVHIKSVIEGIYKGIWRYPAPKGRRAAIKATKEP